MKHIVESFQNDIDIIFEAFKPTMKKGKTPVVVVHGRYSVPHAGHFGLFDLAWKEGKKAGAKKLVIVIVMGAKSSQDKEKNPTTFDERKDLINKGMKTPHDVIKVPNGFIGTIVSDLRDKGYEPVAFAGGPDREPEYKKQVEKFGDDWDLQADVIGVGANRLAGGASATKVRQAIRDNDEASFKKFMPKELHGEWENLRKILDAE
jgi:hypothetical protein